MNLFELSSKDLSKKSGVYKLSAGGHVYIGSSKNLYARLREHKNDLRYNKHANSFLQSVFNKFGPENLLVEIIEFCKPEDRISRESYWIKQLNADMNMTDPETHVLSELSKKKLSDSIKNGRLLGKYKTKYDFSAIERYDYFGDYVCTYQTIEEAMSALNMTKQQIRDLAGGYRKGVTSKGVRLRYSESKVPVQKFDINPQYLGKYYDFYYINDDGIEEIAFHDVRDLYPFMAKQLLKKKNSITIYPKLKTL